MEEGVVVELVVVWAAVGDRDVDKCWGFVFGGGSGVSVVVGDVGEDGLVFCSGCGVGREEG